MSSHPAVERAARKVDDKAFLLTDRTVEEREMEIMSAAAIIERETHYSELLEAVRGECRNHNGGRGNCTCQCCSLLTKLEVKP